MSDNSNSANSDIDAILEVLSHVEHNLHTLGETLTNRIEALESASKPSQTPIAIQLPTPKPNPEPVYRGTLAENPLVQLAISNYVPWHYQQTALNLLHKVGFTWWRAFLAGSSILATGYAMGYVVIPATWLAYLQAPKAAICGPVQPIQPVQAETIQQQPIQQVQP